MQALRMSQRDSAEATPDAGPWSVDWDGDPWRSDPLDGQRPELAPAAPGSAHDALGLFVRGHRLERERLLPEMVMTVQRFGYDADAVAGEQEFLQALLHEDEDEAIEAMRGKRSFAVAFSILVATGFIAGALAGLDVVEGQDLEPAFSFGSLVSMLTARPIADADGDGISDADELAGGSDPGDATDPLIENGRTWMCHKPDGGGNAKHVKLNAVSGHVRHGDHFGTCAEDAPDPGDDDNGDGDDGHGGGTDDGDGGDGNGTDDGNGPGDDNGGNGTGGPGGPAGNDTDGDGIDDAIEVLGGSDPRDPASPGVVDGQVIVCHDNNQTLRIAVAAVPAHIAHGDRFGVCPPVADSDGDGLPDAWEQEHFGDLDQNGSGDPDGDGLDNAGEHAAGTDPLDPDTDGDGLSDGDEVDAGTDPLDASSPGTPPSGGGGGGSGAGGGAGGGGGGSGAGGAGGGGGATPTPSQPIGPGSGDGARAPTVLLANPPAQPRTPPIVNIPEFADQVTGLPGGLVQEARALLDRNLGRLENPSIAMADAGAGSNVLKVSRKVAMLLDES